jgi:hypothetical protein
MTGIVAAAAGVSFLVDPSSGGLIALSGPAGVYVAEVAIDTHLEQGERECNCSVSYALDLDRLRIGTGLRSVG